MSEASVRILVQADRREADALYDALTPGQGEDATAYTIEKKEGGLAIKVEEGSLSDVRALTNSLLRLLKAARESIDEVERNE